MSSAAIPSAATACGNGPLAAAPAFACRNARITLHELIDAYMAAHGGRDTTRAQRLAWWQRKLGSLALVDLDGDHVHFALQELTTQRGRYWAGVDADGNPIYVVAGEVKRTQGRPPERTAATERDLVDEVFRVWDLLLGRSASSRRSGPRNNDPRMVAIFAVVERHGLSDDQVRGIVEKLRKVGYTRDFWEGYLREAYKRRDEAIAGKVR